MSKCLKCEHTNDCKININNRNSPNCKKCINLGKDINAFPCCNCIGSISSILAKCYFETNSEENIEHHMSYVQLNAEIEIADAEYESELLKNGGFDGTTLALVLKTRLYLLYDIKEKYYK